MRVLLKSENLNEKSIMGFLCFHDICDVNTFMNYKHAYRNTL